MTRALHSSLALANVKMKHGWENLSIDAIEPHIVQELERKRPASSNGTFSDSSSVTGSADLSSVRGFVSSPLTIPTCSDENFATSISSRGAKRRRIGPAIQSATMVHSRIEPGRKSRSATTVGSWKKTHHLAQSSPAKTTKHVMFTEQTSSFMSSTSTILEEPASPILSEEDDTDLPVAGFGFHPTIVDSSPPRTPRQERRMLHKEANVPWSRTPRDGDHGADLLMHLATSPTPAVTATRSLSKSTRPSTPPSMHTSMSSAHIMTPGLFGIPNTPSANVNFADFCNVTPSPARSRWPRTPATAILCTPLALGSDKHRLSYEPPPPASASPSLLRSARKRPFTDPAQ